MITNTIAEKPLEKQVEAHPYLATLRTLRLPKKECRVCHEYIRQGEQYYSVRYRIGIDAHPHAIHARELGKFVPFDNIFCATCGYDRNMLKDWLNGEDDDKACEASLIIGECPECSKAMEG